MQSFVTRQGLDHATFSPPPVDGSLSIPEIYEYNGRHSPDHPAFVYSVKSDVWSLGISLIELALGAFPFSDPPDDDDLSDLEDYARETQKTPTYRDSFILSKKMAKRASKRKSRVPLGPDGGLTTMSIIELMHQIVQEPSPRLPDDLFPTGAEDLVDAMLLKSPEERKTPKELLVSTLRRGARIG